MVSLKICAYGSPMSSIWMSKSPPIKMFLKDDIHSERWSVRSSKNMGVSKFKVRVCINAIEQTILKDLYCLWLILDTITLPLYIRASPPPLLLFLFIALIW